MNKRSIHLLGNIAAFAVVFSIGCGTLQPGGAYAPVNQQADKTLYVADASYKLAYDLLDKVFTIEKENRDVLWKLNPNIKHTIDSIRAQAWPVTQQWAACRKVYLANPVASNLDSLNAALGKLQQLGATAQAALATTTTGGN